MTTPADRYGRGKKPDRRPDEVDALRLLRAADPVDTAELPDADSPLARALYEEITMSTPTTEPNSARPVRRRSYLVAGVAAAALLVAVAVGVTALGGNDGTDPAPVATDTPESDPDVMPGGGMAMCVETYSLETLTNREIAFDGTLVSVDGDEVTFEVHEMFRGEPADTITLGGGESITHADGLSSVAGPGLAVGDRALVSGSDGFAWSCGFTLPYDEATAAAWRDALG